jgi:nicotinate-nucleotide pyrophosphorylase (carboxylating)
MEYKIGGGSLMELSEKLIGLIELAGLSPEYIEKLAQSTIDEDLAGGQDVTSIATIPSNQQSIAEFRNRKRGVIAGLPIVAAVLEICGIKDYKIDRVDGDYLAENSLILTANGSTQSILLAERTALNFLGHLSGIATLTKSWVDAVSGTKTAIRDTRKTTPGLRDLEKYAVRVGGGVNHRLSLSDSALIKDNHLLAAGGVAKAFQLVSEKYPNLTLEVEVDSLQQLQEALDTGAKFILLDNMSVADVRSAVEMTAGRAKLEASGGLDLISAPAYAKTGVDYLAVGALTHSAPVLDIGLDLRMG